MSFENPNFTPDTVSALNQLYQLMGELRSSARLAEAQLAKYADDGKGNRSVFSDYADSVQSIIGVLS